MKKLTSKEVQSVIDEYVKPVIVSHGGDILIKEVKDGTVRITLWGNCQGCPSAQLTTETVVEEKLREHLGDKVDKVILVNEVSPDILNFAKKLIRHE